MYLKDFSKIKTDYNYISKVDNQFYNILKNRIFIKINDSIETDLIEENCIYSLKDNYNVIGCNFDRIVNDFKKDFDNSFIIKTNDLKQLFEIDKRGVFNQLAIDLKNNKILLKNKNYFYYIIKDIEIKDLKLNNENNDFRYFELLNIDSFKIFLNKINDIELKINFINSGFTIERFKINDVYYSIGCRTEVDKLEKIFNLKTDKETELNKKDVINKLATDKFANNQCIILYKDLIFDNYISFHKDIEERTEDEVLINAKTFLKVLKLLKEDNLKLKIDIDNDKILINNDFIIDRYFL